MQVEFFRLDECLEELAELLHSYRTLRQNEGSISPEDTHMFQKQLRPAQDTFRAMFGRRLGDEAFLLENPEDSVLETLKTWTEEILGSQRTDLISGLTVKGCSDLLKQLGSARKSATELVIWPYIRKVKSVRATPHTHVGFVNLRAEFS